MPMQNANVVLMLVLFVNMYLHQRSVSGLERISLALLKGFSLLVECDCLISYRHPSQ